MIKKIKNPQFWKNPTTIAMLFFCILFLVTPIIRRLRMPSTNIDAILFFHLSLSKYYFLALIIFAFHILRGAHSVQLQETMIATSRGFRSHFFKQWISLVGVVFVVALLNSGLTFLSFVTAEETRFILSFKEWLFPLLMWAFLYPFLYGLLSVCIGAALSFVEQTLLAYFFIIGFILFTSLTATLFSPLITAITGFDGYRILLPFHLFQDLFSFSMNPAIAYAMQRTDIWRFAFLCCICLYVIFRNIMKVYGQGYPRKIFAFLLGGSILFTGVMLYRPSSFALHNHGGRESFDGVQGYYEQHAAQVVPVDWHIQKYALKVDFKRQLEVSATLTLNAPQNLIYLTLYHGYLVDNIFDASNRALSFTQEGDYITIIADEPIHEITIEYKGCSNHFPANETVAYLPGQFPWYPVQGFQKVYNTNTYSFDRVSLSHATQFKIETNRGDVFSNLGIISSSIEGEAYGITLLHGLFSHAKYNGIDLYFPLILDKEELNQLPQIVEMIKSHPRVPDSIESILIYGGYQLLYNGDALGIYPDHVALSEPIVFEENIQNYDINLNKIELKTAMSYFFLDRELFFELARSTEEEAYSGIIDVPPEEILRMDYQYRLAKLLEKDELFVIQEYERTMNDEEDDRTIIQFIEDLEEKLK